MVNSLCKKLKLTCYSRRICAVCTLCLFPTENFKFKFEITKNIDVTGTPLERGPVLSVRYNSSSRTDTHH